jgi:hypothetical protein
MCLNVTWLHQAPQALFKLFKHGSSPMHVFLMSLAWALLWLVIGYELALAEAVATLLTGCITKLKFNDFISDPFPLVNRTTQGNLSSMNYYSFYNAPLIESASSEDELSLGFVDDSMMLTIRDSLAQCHEKLKNMMEQSGGGFEWLLTHNSPFELSKMVLMNFPRLYRDCVPGALSLAKSNPDGSVTASLVHPVSLYKYLGITFNPKLHWSLHQTKALTTASYWSLHIWHLSESASGVSPIGVK